MKVLIPVVFLVLSITLVFAVVWAAALRAKVVRLSKALAGMEDPKSWLSDEDRRKYALELLEREKAQYQDSLTNKYLGQVTAFDHNTPTKKEGSK